MKPTTVTQTGTGTSAWQVLDFRLQNGVAYRVNTSGTVTYTVEDTFNDVFNTPSTSIVAENSPSTNMVAATDTQRASYQQTPFANRLVVSAGAGTATLINIPQGRMG